MAIASSANKTEKLLKIGIVGAAGRMGRTLLEEVIATPECVLSGGLDKPGSPAIGRDLGDVAGLTQVVGINSTDDPEKLVAESDAIIDFSSPASTMMCAQLTDAMKKIHIIGTTGLSEEQVHTLEKHAKNTAIVFAPNMSVGVNLLLSLVQQAAAILDESYDIEIVEMHHRHKMDAPSGTALAIGRSAAAGRGVDLNKVARMERSGMIGPRANGEIGFSTLRGGDVVGDHTVVFAAEGERIEITHKASSRRIFARGAVRAALWAQGRQPGLYSLKDVLEKK